jgi:hypothetical protein
VALCLPLEDRAVHLRDLVCVMLTSAIVPVLRHSDQLLYFNRQSAPPNAKAGSHLERVPGQQEIRVAARPGDSAYGLAVIENGNLFLHLSCGIYVLPARLGNTVLLEKGTETTGCLPYRCSV